MTFAEGFIAKKPHDKAPDFVKAHISVKVEDAIKFLQDSNKKGWVNLDLKEAKSGNFYLELNEWKPEKKSPENESVLPEYPPDINPEDIPF